MSIIEKALGLIENKEFKDKMQHALKLIRDSNRLFTVNTNSRKRKRGEFEASKLVPEPSMG
jgi:hypothetical protein